MKCFVVPRFSGVPLKWTGFHVLGVALTHISDIHNTFRHSSTSPAGSCVPHTSVSPHLSAAPPAGGSETSPFPGVASSDPRSRKPGMSGTTSWLCVDFLYTSHTARRPHMEVRPLLGMTFLLVPPQYFSCSSPLSASCLKLDYSLQCCSGTLSDPESWNSLYCFLLLPSCLFCYLIQNVCERWNVI